MSSSRILTFRHTVWVYYKKHGRNDLPWRKTRDPYRILVSEVMLQQTQVPRVIGKYKEFLKAFPTVRALAKAQLGDVLRVWSGLGYNRRGKYLRDAAKGIVEKHGGRVPKDAAALRALPGIGEYTAGAVRVFAFSEHDVLIETNIRAVYIHSLPNIGIYEIPISDRSLLTLAQEAAKGQDPRTWHWALMDYGAHIKKLHKNPARKSAHYVRQSKFEGSLRQVRGAVLRALANGGKINDLRNRYDDRLEDALAGLARDGLIVKQKGKSARLTDRGPVWRIS